MPNPITPPKKGYQNARNPRCASWLESTRFFPLSQFVCFSYAFTIPGTLAADARLCWKVPFDCTLIHVSATAANNSDATLKIGTTASGEAYLAAATIGDSLVPAEFDLDNFVDAEYPHIPAGTIFYAYLDFDGSSGTAAQNVTIVFTFSEG